MFDTNSEVQKLWIEMLCSKDEIFNTCNRIINSEYFDPSLRPVVNFIKNYYEEYHSIPSNRMIQAETGVHLADVQIHDHEIQYCTDQIEKFCRERAVYLEVLNASRTIDSGGYGALVEKLQKAVSISLNRDLGINIFENIEERIKKRMEQRNPVSTGWPNVDVVLGGGWCRTELMMLSAASGGGKSIGLSNIAIHMAEQGYTVLYVSLELGEEFVADRLETMITGMGKEDRFSNIPDVCNKMHAFRSNSNGSIYVKYMEADVACPNDILAYIKEFHNQYGKYPDVLLVDYLDILAPNTKMNFQNVFEKDKATTTQLRNLGNNQTHPMWMATASQENRSAIGETDKSQSHIAGGLSKVNTVDIYISIIMTDAMRAENIAMWKFLKTRSSDGVGKVVDMIWDPIRLRFKSTDSAPSRAAFQPAPTQTAPAAMKKSVHSLDDLMES